MFGVKKAEEPKLKPWLLIVSANSIKTIPPISPYGATKTETENHEVRYRFLSDAETFDEVFAALHANGFCCVVKTSDGRIVPAGNLKIVLAREARK